MQRQSTTGGEPKPWTWLQIGICACLSPGPTCRPALGAPWGALNTPSSFHGASMHLRQQKSMAMESPAVGRRAPQLLCSVM